MQKAPMSAEGGRPVHIEWRCDAVVQESSHEFAKELQQKLNTASTEGFSLVQMMGRAKDDGLVLIHQKATMLVDGEAQDDATRSEFHSIIQAQAQRLNRLIDDILNISRIESGLVKVSKEPVSMTMLIRDAVQMIRSYAAEKNITINEQTPIVFDQAMADKDMISQVIINLLSNAVKYTPAGGSVHIGTEVDETDGIVRVTVTDNGVGIPAVDLPHVFDKFYRVAANNKCAKGTGLGLNLVKEIVEKVHDGRVFVTSERGKGSVFGFDLPLGVQEAVGADSNH